MADSSIPDNSNIYRSITKSTWTNGNQSVSPAAFLLRARDNGELSVLSRAECSEDVCFGDFNKCYGEIVIGARKVRDLNLEVEPRSLPNKPFHAAVLNLPSPDNFVEAERMASLMVKIVDDIRRRSSPFKKSK